MVSRYSNQFQSDVIKTHKPLDLKHMFQTGSQNDHDHTLPCNSLPKQDCTPPIQGSACLPAGQ